MPLAGSQAAEGTLSVVAILLAGIAGSVVGALPAAPSIFCRIRLALFVRTMAMAGLLEAMWLSAHGSGGGWRVAGRRNRAGPWAAARSTARRSRPGPADAPSPRRGIGRTIERARHARWRRRWSQPSSLARQGIAARDVPGGGGALFGPLAGAPALARPHARHGVRDRGERLAVVAVRARWRHAERRAPVLRCSGAPCSRAAPSPPGPGPSGPGRSSRPLVPRWTRRPGEARDQPGSPARSSRSSRTRCRRSRPPAAGPAASASPSCPGSRTPPAAASPRHPAARHEHDPAQGIPGGDPRQAFLRPRHRLEQRRRDDRRHRARDALASHERRIRETPMGFAGRSEGVHDLGQPSSASPTGGRATGDHRAIVYHTVGERRHARHPNDRRRATVGRRTDASRRAGQLSP